VDAVSGKDPTVTLDVALARPTGIIDQLVVHPQHMQKHLDKLGGLHNSQRVLLALTQAGASREDAYALVQRNAMKTWEQGKDFLAELKADKDVTAKLKPAELEAMFDLGYHFKQVDTIFKRVFGKA
jgi:adenylosuccinate lyase